MLIEIVTSAGVIGTCIGAYYGWRQSMYAREQNRIVQTLTKQQEDRPHNLEQPQIATSDKTTPQDYVTLGEFVWYLCYPPYTTPAHIFNAINNFLKQLDVCGLKDTRATAKPLESITLFKNVNTGYITPDSLLTLVNVMEVVKSSVENELRKRSA
jgi:hypothetical protein